MAAAARQLWHRYGFALAYLGGFLAVELTCTLLTPAAQTRVIAWASTAQAPRTSCRSVPARDAAWAGRS